MKELELLNDCFEIMSGLTEPERAIIYVLNRAQVRLPVHQIVILWFVVYCQV